MFSTFGEETETSENIRGPKFQQAVSPRIEKMHDIKTISQEVVNVFYCIISENLGKI